MSGAITVHSTPSHKITLSNYKATVAIEITPSLSLYPQQQLSTMDLLWAARDLLKDWLREN